MLLRFDPFRELDRAFDDAWRGAPRTSIPMDAVRHEDRVFMNFDLPGVDPDAVDLTVERNVLTIKAERGTSVQEGDQVLAEERPKGIFVRRVLLGDTLDTTKLEAAYDHGVLTVTIPVAEQAQPRRISIGGGAGQAGAIEADSHEADTG
jgi:HSP20 family protein